MVTPQGRPINVDRTAALVRLSLCCLSGFKGAASAFTEFRVALASRRCLWVASRVRASPCPVRFLIHVHRTRCGVGAIVEFFWTRPITASSVTVRSVRHMADTGVMSDNIIKLLVVGELYIGAAECDAGLARLAEVLQIARDQGANGILILGNLFCSATPPLRAVQRAMRILDEHRMKVLAGKAAQTRSRCTVSDPFDNDGLSSAGAAHVYVIRGSAEQQPRTGLKATALDLLDAAGLISFTSREGLGPRSYVEMQSAPLLDGPRTSLRIYSVGHAAAPESKAALNECADDAAMITGSDKFLMLATNQPNLLRPVTLHLAVARAWCTLCLPPYPSALSLL